MFTGIIQTQAKVSQLQHDQGIIKLVIEVETAAAEKLNLGASIAINGCCLTVVKITTLAQTTEIHFDVIDETLKRTNLGALGVNHKVNFERSVTFGTELGGHIVSGHIHCVAKVLTIEKLGNNCKMQLSLPESWLKYVLYKGFITINGASLTVGEIAGSSFYIHLIPETLAITNLDTAEVGDELNIEVDQHTYTIVNTVENYLAQKN